MRNKNVVVFLLAVFSFICVYNIYHTYNTFSMESALNEAIASDKQMQKENPDWSNKYRKELEDNPKWVESYGDSQKKSFSLGLDLQGGMFVTMEIGVDELVRSLAGNPEDSLFNKAIEKAREMKVDRQESFVDLFYEAFLDLDANVKLANYYADPDIDINFNTSNEEVVSYLKQEANKAFENTFGILRTRIDQFGVASPNLVPQAATGRIFIELPGVREPERVRKLLRNTAKLEFWETYPFGEGYNELMKLNDVVKKIKGFVSDDSTATDTASALASDSDAPFEDPTSLSEGIEEGDALAVSADSTLTDSADLAGIAEDDSTDEIFGDDGFVTEEDSLEQREKFLKDFPLFENFSFPQQEQLAAYPNSPLMGYMRARDTAKFNAWLRHPDVMAVMPNEVKFLWEAKPINEEEGWMGLVAIKTNADDQAPLDGEAITSARQDFSQDGLNQSVVSMNMNAEGANKWKDLTTDNVGKSVAIVMDDMVFSYPTVNGPITGGRSQIEGSFTIEEAKDLATLLSSGRLPVKATIQGEEIVGPTLGEKNITSGLWSFLVAFAITIVFMGFYYNSSGLVANVALICNIIFILGVSAAMNVVLTLPGIAAIVLTMGMAVDANVLIFERIREEQKLGKSLKASIASGFKNAFSSVMDANITTFLTGVVLYAFGVGPIRGFAVNLMIGIVTSLISALFITRLILDYYGEKGNDSVKFGSQMTLSIFDNLDLKMTVRKKVFYVVSGGLILFSIASMAIFGFKTGVDFDGGRQYVVGFDEGTQLNVEATRDQLMIAFENNAPVIKTIGGENRLLITTNYKVKEQDASDIVKNKLIEALAAANGVVDKANIQILSERLVGPTVAADIKRSAVSSVISSLIIIFLYILIRFRKWQYSLGALASLVHDVIITLGVFSILGTLDFLPFSVEIDQAFIAAILTIVGYSINDTVVVFDRIRENLGEMKTKSLSEVYDTSINQTMSRTLITSFTTMLTILILFVMGGDTIKGFMFALLVGIVFGTYSSIFVASPISHDLILNSKDGQVEEDKKDKRSKRAANKG